MDFDLGTPIILPISPEDSGITGKSGYPGVQIPIPLVPDAPSKQETLPVLPEAAYTLVLETGPDLGGFDSAATINTPLPGGTQSAGSPPAEGAIPAPGGAAPTGGMPEPEAVPAGPGEAYTLTLGGEQTPGPPGPASGGWTLSAYDMLGKSTVKQPVPSNPVRIPAAPLNTDVPGNGKPVLPTSPAVAGRTPVEGGTPRPEGSVEKQPGEISGAVRTGIAAGNELTPSGKIAPKVMPFESPEVMPFESRADAPGRTVTAHPAASPVQVDRRETGSATQPGAPVNRLNIGSMTETPAVDKLFSEKAGFIIRDAPLTEPDNRSVLQGTVKEMDSAAVPTASESIGVLPSLAAGAGKIIGDSGTVYSGSLISAAKIMDFPFSLYVFGYVPITVTDRETGEDVNPHEDGGEDGTHQGTAFLKIYETVRMAAVLHNLYYGGNGVFNQGTPSYSEYVRYALRNGIIHSGDFADFGAFTTRAEVAEIFSGCVPRAELPAINRIDSLPDVSESDRFGAEILLLLRAGVFTPVGGSGLFYPNRVMTRDEAATVIGRIVTPKDRKNFTQGTNL